MELCICETILNWSCWGPELLILEKEKKKKLNTKLHIFYYVLNSSELQVLFWWKVQLKKIFIHSLIDSFIWKILANLFIFILFYLFSVSGYFIIFLELFLLFYVSSSCFIYSVFPGLFPLIKMFVSIKKLVYG